MRNLAGDKECDTVIAGELAPAGVELVHGKRSDHEVATSITGKPGKFVFTRAWYYWVVLGKVPLDVAQKLYASEIGKKDVRVSGHCACPAPIHPWVKWYAPDGKQLVTDPEGKQEREYREMVERHPEWDMPIDSYRFVPDASAVPGAQGFVETYHINSQEGLNLFVKTLKEHGLDKE